MIERYTKQKNIKSGNISIEKKDIQGIFPTHWHEFYEIEFILDGCGEYIIDGKKYEIKKGMLFFITPINFHEVKTTKSQIINIMFSDAICSRDTLFSLTADITQSAFYFSEDELPFINELLNELILSAEQKDIIYSSSLLNTLLLKTGKKAKNKSIAELTYVQSAILYTLNNFRSKLTLSETAAHIGLSSSYLSSMFPAEAGMTFKEYLNSLRFEYAKKLLIFSDMNVSEICFESGFEDYANFLRRFKKHFGLPPGQFRRRYRLSAPQ